MLPLLGEAAAAAAAAAAAGGEGGGCCWGWRRPLPLGFAANGGLRRDCRCAGIVVACLLPGWQSSGLCLA